MRKLQKLLNSSLSVLCAALSMSACNVTPNANSNNTPADFADWDVKVSYVEHERSTDAFKRIIKLEGDDVDQVAVDMQIEGEENWHEVARTDEDGIFIDTNASFHKVRYRLDGRIETRWFDKAETKRLAGGNYNSQKISGYRCILAADKTIFLYGKTLELDCHEVIIEGNILSFQAAATGGRRDPATAGCGAYYDGSHSGNLIVKAELAQIWGKISLNGQDGFIEEFFNPSTSERTTRGTSGGNAGTITIQAKNLLENPDVFEVNAGNAAATTLHPRCTRPVRGAPGRIVKIQNQEPSRFYE